MTKEFKCKKCSCYLGEMNKGKLKNGVAILCEECMSFYETCDSLVQYNKRTGNVNPLGDIFGKDNPFAL